MGQLRVPTGPMGAQTARAENFPISGHRAARLHPALGLVKAASAESTLVWTVAERVAKSIRSALCK